MAACAPMPSFLLASCCSVLVVNGAGGLRRARLRSTCATLNVPASTAAFARFASSALLRSNCSSLRPSRCVSRAVNGAPRGVVNPASTVQYSRARNTSISASRSHTRRRATDCTRPALRLPGSLRHSTGGKREAHQIIQRAAGQVRLDQRLIQLARMRHGVLHGGFGDFVEGDPLHFHALQSVLFRQHGAYMPRYRLAFAIRIGGEGRAAWPPSAPSRSPPPGARPARRSANPWRNLRPAARIRPSAADRARCPKLARTV